MRFIIVLFSLLLVIGCSKDNDANNNDQANECPVCEEKECPTCDDELDSLNTKLEECNDINTDLKEQVDDLTVEVNDLKKQNIIDNTDYRNFVVSGENFKVLGNERHYYSFILRVTFVVTNDLPEQVVFMEDHIHRIVGFYYQTSDFYEDINLYILEYKPDKDSIHIVVKEFDDGYGIVHINKFAIGLTGEDIDIWEAYELGDLKVQIIE